MSEIKHAVDCSCVICEPDDEWTYTEEAIPPHPLCCSECKTMRERVAYECAHKHRWWMPPGSAPTRCPICGTSTFAESS